MVFPFDILSKKPTAPERVPTDEVIPLFDRDDTAPNRAIALDFTMVFDDVLNAEKLSGALWRLLERPGWRKLGARLRLNAQGKLEYHVPAQYTQDRPPIHYSHSVEPMPLSEHPFSKAASRPNGKLQCFTEMGQFRCVSDERKGMTVLNDWIYSDKPQLGLDIINFQDATFVTLTWLHTFLDAIGRSALLRAWQAVLEGRDDDVPPFVGYDIDPLAPLGSKETDTEPFVLAPKRVSKLGLARFVFNWMYESYYYPVEEGRIICIPASYFAKLKARAFADLESLPKDQLTFNGNDPTKPFISDGDILMAFILPIIARSDPANASSAPSRLICAGNVCGIRDIMRNTSPPLLPQNGAYIHTAVIPIWSLFTLDEWLTLPVGHIAARLRSDLVVQSSRAQIEARHALEAKSMGLYGSGDMTMTVLSNWTKAKLFDTDFSAAIVKGEKGSGKPRHIQPFSTQAGFQLRNSGNCSGRDRDGNWWMGVIMRKELVDEFAKQIERLAEEF